MVSLRRSHVVTLGQPASPGKYRHVGLTGGFRAEVPDTEAEVTPKEKMITAKPNIA